MHTYLRAIGFSRIKKRTELDEILGIVMTNPTLKNIHKVNDTEEFVEMFCDFSDFYGVCVRGSYDEKGFFHMDHYFPYLNGYIVSLHDEVSINKKVDTIAYSGLCDDLRFGVSIIFYLQNAVNYIESYAHVRDNIFNVTLVGLSIDGKIILPVDKSKKSTKARDNEKNNRNRLIAEAKQGNQEAIDSLTIEDIDTYAMVSRRAKHEDVYSIVDTTFFPYGAESDNYSIIGTILGIKLIENGYTKEQVYILDIECNELAITVCINKDDLYGEPMVGARFKGIIWLQGYVEF
ncbi:MAG: DUF3881 family protein [Lachnospiraceae bacterium]|nr:DUF3881 family protein [Lachnospiraceae bacterium]